MSEYSVYLNGAVNTEVFPRKFSNQIYFSEYANFYLEYKSIYSVKYQISGLENYKLDSKNHRIHPNRYFVVNNDQDVICLTGCSEKSISIFIEPELLTDVFNNSKKNNEELLTNPYDIDKNEPMFFENSYPLEDNHLSRLLSNFSKSFDAEKKNHGQFGINFFFKISEALILSQQETFKQIKNIDGVKKTTREELYRRIVKAQEIILENWQKNISVVLLARLVSMSPYHFNRTFSSILGISPSRYHKLIKMQKAKELISEENYSISQIARIIGYENIHSFSKAFKKHFGVSPSNSTNKYR